MKIKIANGACFERTIRCLDANELWTLINHKKLPNPTHDKQRQIH